MKKRIVLSICLICIIGVGIYFFHYLNNQLLRVGLSNDYVLVDTLEEANDSAKYIIKGQFKSYENEWNMHRDDHDILKEHPYEKITGRIYSFHIDDVLKGDINEQNVSVNFMYSTRLFFNSEGLLHGKDIVNSKNVEYIDYREKTYVEPELNKDYILYLNYDEDFSLYYAAFQPYMIKIEQNHLSIQSQLMVSDVIDVNTYQTKSRKIEVREEFEKVNDFVKDITLEEFINKLK